MLHTKIYLDFLYTSLYKLFFAHNVVLVFILVTLGYKVCCCRIVVSCFTLFTTRKPCLASSIQHFLFFGTAFVTFLWFSLVWFLCLMAYQLFLGYLMPKPFS